MNESNPSEPSSEPSDRIAGRRILIERALFLSLLGSLMLHAIGIVVAYSTKIPEISIEIDMQESAGVALMAQIGWAEPEDEPDSEEFVDVEPAEERLPEPEEVPEPEEAPDPEEATDPETEDDPPTETDPEVTQPEETPPRGERNPSEESAEPGEEPAETEPEPEPVDPAQQPPSQRHPEGTVNPVATDVGMWGPEGAASVAVVRNDRIRRSPHRDAIEAIFGGLGDTQHLTENTDIDLIDDIDTMLLASTNISDARRTFVAAVHHLDPGYLMSELRTGFPSGVNWEQRSDGRFFGTPGASTAFERRFLLPVDRLLIYSQPDLLDDLLRGAPRVRGLDEAEDQIGETIEPPATLDEVLVELGLPEERPAEYVHNEDCSERRGLGRRRCRERRTQRTTAANRTIAAYDEQRAELLPEAEARVDEARDAYREARGNGRRNGADSEPPIRDDVAWIRGLLESADLAGTGRTGPAVLWTFNGFRSFHIDGMDEGTPSPSSLIAALTLGRTPRFEGRFVFESGSQARAFSEQWDGVVEHYTFALMAAGLHGAFRSAEWEIDHNEAIVSFAVPGAALNRIAAVLALGG